MSAYVMEVFESMSRSMRVVLIASSSSSRQLWWFDELVMRPHEPVCGEGFLGVQLR